MEPTRWKMFRGTYEHTVDEKGRVSVPIRFREFLQATNDDRVVITNFKIGSTPCLDVYPHAIWAQLEEQLRVKPQFGAKILSFVTYYVGNAAECEIDKQGRILLPPTLREYAMLKKDVVFTSALTKFRIWDREHWKQVFDGAAEQVTQHPELLEELGI